MFIIINYIITQIIIIMPATGCVVNCAKLFWNNFRYKANVIKLILQINLKDKLELRLLFLIALKII